MCKISLEKCKGGIGKGRESASRIKRKSGEMNEGNEDSDRGNIVREQLDRVREYESVCGQGLS
jgi:hypothetical protein